MKKTVTLLILISAFLITTPVLAGEISNDVRIGVMQYKRANYVGCMQTMQSVTGRDPGNVLAHYYLAISYVQIGKKEEAIKEYNKVIAINPGSAFAYYAKRGIDSLNAAPNAGTSPTPVFKPANTPIPAPSAGTSGTNLPTLNGDQDYMSDKAKNVILEKNINSLINDVNENRNIDTYKMQRINNMTKNKSSNDAPSKEEVAQAWDTLKKAGLSLNPYQNFNQNINPELMQMQMLTNAFGGGSNNNGMGNNYMNMLPMMMYQNPESLKKIDPKVIETMVTSMMMPDMFSSINTNEKNE